MSTLPVQGPEALAANPDAPIVLSWLSSVLTHRTRQDTTPYSLPEAVNRVIAAAGLSVRQFAQMVGSSQPAISRMQSGINHEPGLLERIAEQATRHGLPRTSVYLSEQALHYRWKRTQPKRGY